MDALKIQREGLDSELVLTPQSHSHSQTRITFKNTHIHILKEKNVPDT